MQECGWDYRRQSRGGSLSGAGVCTGIRRTNYRKGRWSEENIALAMFSCKLLQIGHTDFQGIWPIYMQRWNRSRSGPEYMQHTYL